MELRKKGIDVAELTVDRSKANVRNLVDLSQLLHGKLADLAARDKLESRLRAVLADNRVTVDENRILTECAIYADRIAIDEELVRLRSHFGAFAEIAREKTPSGKKLDFLMQELNRETNTIGSKANNSEIAHLVVEMKNELEKIREQVQNVE